MDGVVPEADPREALATYIGAKMAMSAARPDASRVFDNELLHGAPVLGKLMRPSCVQRSSPSQRSSTAGWRPGAWRRSVRFTCSSRSGLRRRPVPTSTCKVRAVLSRKRQTRRDHERAAAHVVWLILRG